MYCNACNHTFKDTFNFNRHTASKKHKILIQKHRTQRSPEINIINKNELDDKYDLLANELKEQKEAMKNLKEEIDKKNEIINNNTTNNITNTNNNIIIANNCYIDLSKTCPYDLYMYRAIVETYRNPPLLEKYDDYDRLLGTNNPLEIIKKILTIYEENKFAQYIATLLNDAYTFKKHPEKQAIWSSKVSRESFIINIHGKYLDSNTDSDEDNGVRDGTNQQFYEEFGHAKQDIHFDLITDRINGLKNEMEERSSVLFIRTKDIETPWIHDYNGKKVIRIIIRPFTHHIKQIFENFINGIYDTHPDFKKFKKDIDVDQCQTLINDINYKIFENPILTRLCFKIVYKRIQ